MKQRAPLFVAILFLLLTGVSCVFSQDSKTPEELRSASAVMQIRSDSLKKLWDAQWKRSDSLRVEAMFLRMRSDSLRKAAKVLESRARSLEAETIRIDTVHTDTIAIDSTILKTLEDETRLRSNMLRVQTGAVKSGQTLSDTLTMQVMTVESDTGTASYYAEAFHGKKTSSGERYDMNGLTCAHRWLPYNTHLRVTNLTNGKSVVVRVTDRGPWKHTRLIDVSKGAAKELDMIRSGTTRVVIEVVTPDK
ncbi:MAG TPA: septal ring lytic transglycosylase RlpA family protein [Candidatus Didemnitutus sp.]|nr:septal ring lytic transglycosylase RlpA family protein [Candidatus Didemnitutus sp.]